ncbi:conserved exported hypothetical protein [Mesorhizobium metallidurans STM 2683]|uniref:DUF680 domain-containing protein n=1 Tax=Mesorhizobium metallidurans STM 2683 TaxID=1297569 RepID=M5EPN9_9HYPH|nr:DUF680 domain-containing protein [Mesorhizobium metallidurans]CCV06098.1 conserved exported hypothetical protein [Mesorhizobium metallidurans STM 2683]
MTGIALTAAAILVATSSAIAGSDHYGSANANQPAAPVAANIDNSFTASIKKSDAAAEKPVTQGSDRNLFGNR